MEFLQRLLDQFREFWSSLSLLRRIALIGASLLILIALAGVSYLSPSSSGVPLFSQSLPLDEVAAIDTKLTELNITHEVDKTTMQILVPEDQLAAARVALAGEGLPTQGGKGYELFEASSFGTTPFQQNVNYQRALQTELARSIMQLEPVSAARVMIARPESTPFIRDQNPPTASVVVKLKAGATMNRKTAASVVSLVARSVDGLKEENVTMLDSSGRLLSDPHAGQKDEIPTAQLEYRQAMESYLSQKAEEMLSMHLGQGRAVIRVSADINFQKLKQMRETYSPDEKAVGMERLVKIKSNGTGSGGVAGTSSNIATSANANGSRSGSSSEEETIETDYLVSKTVQEVENGMGAITRLTIAALVDLTPSTAENENTTAPISSEDAQEIIKKALGFQTARGDEIQLTNVRLGGPMISLEPDETVLSVERFESYVSLARNICLAIATVMAVAIIPLALLRRRRKQEAASENETPPAAEVPTGTAAAVNEEGFDEPAPPPGPTVVPVLPPSVMPPLDPNASIQDQLQRFRDLAATEPNRVSTVLELLLAGEAR